MTHWPTGCHLVGFFSANSLPTNTRFLWCLHRNYRASLQNIWEQQTSRLQQLMMERYIYINQCVLWTKCYLYFPGQDCVFLSRAVIDCKKLEKKMFWHPFLLSEKASRMEEVKEEHGKSDPPPPSV